MKENAVWWYNNTGLWWISMPLCRKGFYKSMAIKVECLFCSIVWKGSRLVKMALQCHMFETPHCTECETYRTITSIASNVFFGIPDISSRIDQSTMYGHTILNMYIEDVCSNQNLYKLKCNTRRCLLLKNWSYFENNTFQNTKSKPS